MVLRGPSRLTGHLGSSVSALVDGQLDPDSTERGWRHVDQCPACRRLVEHEGWVKRQLAHIAETPSAELPSERFVGALLDLDPTAAAWAETTEVQARERGRRRAGIALVGAGSVSAAVLGLATLSGSPVSLDVNNTPVTSIGRAGTPSPTPAPSASPSSARPTQSPFLPVVAPPAVVRGQLRGYTLDTDADDDVRARLAFVPR